MSDSSHPLLVGYRACQFYEKACGGFKACNSYKPLKTLEKEMQKAAKRAEHRFKVCNSCRYQIFKAHL